jgi:RTX calcium-binding nonapeptide repeat (4 copies)
VTSRPVTRSIATTVVVVVVALAAPSVGGAATTCDYSSSAKFLQVQLGDKDDAILEVVGGEIVVRNASSAQVSCTGSGGPPFTTNTNTIQVFNQSGNTENHVAIQGAGQFAPGATAEVAENGGTAEVEIFVNLNDGSSAVLDVFTDGTAGGSTRMGKSGVNPNATSSESQPDADIFPSGIQEMDIRNLGSNAADVLGAQGGLGTGDPFTVGIQLDAAGGPDEVVGSEGVDFLRGASGDDVLSAMGGSDNIKPDENSLLTADDDTIDGGPGTDTVSYFVDASGGVTVDLGVTARQDTGGGENDSLVRVENLIGTTSPDVIRGGPGTNALFGLGGADGFDVRDGGPDTVDCGADNDTVTADAPGVDTLIACETVLHPVAETPPSTTPTPASTPTPPSAPFGPVLAEVALRSLRLAPAVFEAFDRGPSVRNAVRRPRGTVVSFRANMPASVTYRVARALPGRRVGRRCVAPSRANRGGRRCTRFVLIRGSFTRAASAGANRFRFTGRIGGRKLAPGSYRLQATPRAGGRNGPTARAAFRIVP